MLTFKEYLEEAKFDDCIKKFGKILFGTELEMGEPDTPDEKRSFEAIVDFMTVTKSGDMKGAMNQVVRVFKDLAKCKQAYPNVLDPKTNKIYRGTHISFNEFRFSKWNLKKLSGIPEMRVADSFVYKPHGEVQSWSSNPIVAWWFPHGTHGIKRFMMPENIAFATINRIEKRPSTKESIPIIYKAVLPDNELIMNPNFSNKISVENFKLRGDEIVRISKNAVKCQAMMHPDLYEFIVATKGKDIFFKSRPSTIEDHPFDPANKQLKFKF